MLKKGDKMLKRPSTCNSSTYASRDRLYQSTHLQPQNKNTSYKAIHYERQTQLRYKHTFDLTPFFQELPRWCQVDEPGVFVLTFDFTLPDRRKIKRCQKVFDLVSTKEFEAAHAGLMYARCIFDIFADELYKYGCRFDKGLQIGPSWTEKGKVKTCITLSVPAFTSEVAVPDVLIFATQAIFSAKELNHMEAVTAKVYFNGNLLGALDLAERIYEPLQFSQTYYSSRNIQKILYARVENRNVLYAFKTEEGIRQGMMVKNTVWKPVEIKTKEDIYKSVKDYNVVEFIPAVNKVHQEYPDIITIETDPGDMFVKVLGKQKSWVVNTYVAEKICQTLDQYKIHYVVKFSGNKGWHIQIPVELKEPFHVYQKVVEAIVNKELGNLPDEEKIPAMMANLMQLEDVKSYKDPFFVARRFVDLIGARCMFYQLDDISTVLTLQDLQNLCLRVNPVHREDFLRKGSDIYETGHGPVKVEIPQVISINPYSRFRRQFKLLIDHSSNKKEGKLRSVLSLHSKSGLVSIPAVVYTDRGFTRFSKKMWDYTAVCRLADPERVYNQLEGRIPREYPLLELARQWEMNYGGAGFEKFFNDHKGLLIYLLQNGGEALELLDTNTARWVNVNLWKRTINPLRH